MKAYSILGLIVLCLGFGWYQSHLSTKLAEQNAATQKALAESVSKKLNEAKDEASRVNILLKSYQNVKQEVQYVDRIVVKEVTVYREAVPVAQRCKLNSMWINTYNLSTIAGSEEDTTSGIDGAASRFKANTYPVDDAIALEVTTENNRSCVETAKRLSALQQYVIEF